MASLGELTAGIAHEIQNPLNFVNNFSELNNELVQEAKEELAKGDLEETKAILMILNKTLEKINHHGKRADAIVKGMLAHSRSSSGEKSPPTSMPWPMNICGYPITPGYAGQRQNLSMLTLKHF
jgi:two-component system, NtrC family, sensor kinase